MSISNKALIVSLSISQWAGRKTDKTANTTIETTYATDKRVGNYTKKLLPGADELENIQKQASVIRQFYYKNTVPWCTDGSRMLKSTNYLEFASVFGALKAEFDLAVQAFIGQYPALREAAKARLGMLFNDSDYPTTAKLHNLFDCSVQFMPVPDVGDFRVEILDSEKEAFLKTMADIEVNAVRDCWERLHDVVSKAVSRLQDPEAHFRDSLIENIKETCALLPKLNITDSAELESMRSTVESTLASVTAQTLRDNLTVRGNVSKQLTDITGAMSAFMGGN